MSKPGILLCTVGTSLFRPNLERLKAELESDAIAPDLRAMASAYQDQDWKAVAAEMAKRPSSERLLGAEINSVSSMIEKDHVADNCGLYFLHSDTPQGHQIAEILTEYYRSQGHSPVEGIAIEDLQDQDPKRFRTKGLRNLARQLCKVVRSHSAMACAINATGGYKAQIALAVLLGQAVGVPVYYKHELFSEIIAFPPMPVALDIEVWMQACGMLFALESEPLPASDFKEDKKEKEKEKEKWNEKYESLVERVDIDGTEYLELSPTGQIFHETFRERFRSERDQYLPPAVPLGQKKEPHFEKSGWPGRLPDAVKWLKRITEEIPQVTRCSTFYYDPDLPERTRFRYGSKGIEGIYSNGTATVKFRVETSATTEGQHLAVVARLNEWLQENL